VPRRSDILGNGWPFLHNEMAILDNSDQGDEFRENRRVICGTIDLFLMNSHVFLLIYDGK